MLGYSKSAALTVRLPFQLCLRSHTCLSHKYCVLCRDHDMSFVSKTRFFDLGWKSMCCSLILFQSSLLRARRRPHGLSRLSAVWMSAIPLICDKYTSGRQVCILSHQTHLRPKRRTNPHNRTNNTSLHYQSTPASFQTCPNAVPNAMTIIAPNALMAIADGSTNSSVIVLPTLRGVENTACLTRHISLVLCALVKKTLPRKS